MPTMINRSPDTVLGDALSHQRPRVDGGHGVSNKRTTLRASDQGTRATIFAKDVFVGLSWLVNALTSSPSATGGPLSWASAATERLPQTLAPVSPGPGCPP
jgi:hypothetical protein